MSDENPELDATAIIQRFVRGDVDALAEIIDRYASKLVRAANRLISKLGIDTASLDGEGVVDLAFSEVCQLRDDRRLTSINDSQDFLKLMTVVLRRIVRDEKKHSDAIRRGGAGRMARAGRARGEGKVRVEDHTRPDAAYHQDGNRDAGRKPGRD